MFLASFVVHAWRCACMALHGPTSHQGLGSTSPAFAQAWRSFVLAVMVACRLTGCRAPGMGCQMLFFGVSSSYSYSHMAVFECVYSFDACRTSRTSSSWHPPWAFVLPAQFFWIGWLGSRRCFKEHATGSSERHFREFSLFIGRHV